MYSFSPTYVYLCFVCKTKKIFYFLCCYFIFFKFCGYIFSKPSRKLICPLGGTEAFKGLIVYAKCNRDFYESELFLQFSYFVLLEDEQKLGVGYLINLYFDPILPFYLPYLPIFYV